MVSIPAGIAGEIAAQGGRVTFARFMELALTHPVDGYYRRDEEIIGPHGHFSTAPGLSPEFCRSMARILGDLANAALDEADAAAGKVSSDADLDDHRVALVELGAGGGELARAVLESWDGERPMLRDRLAYTIVEVGGPLRSRQRQVLEGAIERGWRISWTDSVAEALAPVRAGAVFGNEFLDALPVHLVDLEGNQPREAWVELLEGEAREVWGELSTEARAELETALGTTDTAALRPLSRDGILELRPAAGALVEELGATAPDVSLLTVDYGDWFVAPDGVTMSGGGRGRGTGRVGTVGKGAEQLHGRSVRGYFRHQAVDDLYLRVGRQDLTADVDFRTLDFHGRRAGFQTVFYITLADMLRADGGMERLAELRKRAAETADGALEADRQATVFERLLDYQGLGGAFKIMLQVKEKGL